MKTIDITNENLYKYRDILPEEYHEDIGRQYCRAIVGINPDTDETDAAMFWEIRNVERIDSDITAEIFWYKTDDEGNGQELLKSFDVICDYDKVNTSFFELENLTDPEITSFRNEGYAIKNTEGINVFVTVEELSKLDIAKKAPKKYVYSLSDISNLQFKQGIMNCVFHSKYGLLDDLPFLPQTRFDPDISSCVLTDGMVSGFLLIHRMRQGCYRVELLYSDKLDAAINILNMLRYSIHAARDLCDPTDKVLIRMHNDNVTNLMKKLFPGKKGHKVYRGIK